MASFDVLKILNEADRFSDQDQVEKLRLLATTVFEHGRGYGMVADSKSVIEIYTQIRSEHGESATPIMARLMDKAGFKREYISRLNEIPACETKDLSFLYFAELLINISDELGNGQSLDRLKNRIPEKLLGISRDRITTAVQLLQQLIFQRTISLDKEIESLQLLSGWLESIHRQDIAKIVKKVEEEKKEIAEHQQDTAEMMKEEQEKEKKTEMEYHQDTAEMVKKVKEESTVSYLQESHVEGYKCVARSAIGFVYLPNEVSQTNVDIRFVNDNTLYPKASANEVLLSPVVSVTSQNQVLTVDRPAVIELMKTADHHEVGEVKILPIFSNTNESVPPNWEDLNEECEVLDDRIRFKTPHLSYFTVIARFSPPTASVEVDPESDHQVKLTVPELPGFNVTIPPKSVTSPIEAKVTLYYGICQDSPNQQLASAYVRLEPEGQKFSEQVSLDLPIPGYSEIIDENPGAKPQLMYCRTGSSNDWEIHEDMEIVEVEREYVAQFSTDQFYDYRLNWPMNTRGVAKATGRIFKRVKSLRGRCQVFMSNETEMESVLNFSIQVLVYPFQDPPHPIPCNYHYTLYDSGTLAVNFIPGDLHFSMKLKEHLYPEKDKNRRFEKHHRLLEDSAVQAHFDVDLEKKSKSQLVEGAVIAHLSVKDSLNEHEWNLIKPSQREESRVSPSSGSLLRSVNLQLPSMTATTRLGLCDMTFYLWPARFKWREIGIVLSIDASTLEVIEKDHRRVDDCFVAVLSYFLRNGTAEPCWKVLAEALSSPPVGVIVTSKEDESRSEECAVEEDGPKFKEDENTSSREERTGSSEECTPQVEQKGDESSRLSEECVPQEVQEYGAKLKEEEGESISEECTPQDEEDEQQATLEDESSSEECTPQVKRDEQKGYVGPENNAGLSDRSVVKQNVQDVAETDVPTTVGRSRHISPWWFLSVLSVSGFVAVGFIWFIRRWRK